MFLLCRPLGLPVSFTILCIVHTHRSADGFRIWKYPQILNWNRRQGSQSPWIVQSPFVSVSFPYFPIVRNIRIVNFLPAGSWCKHPPVYSWLYPFWISVLTRRHYKYKRPDQLMLDFSLLHLLEKSTPMNLLTLAIHREINPFNYWKYDVYARRNTISYMTCMGFTRPNMFFTTNNFRLRAAKTRVTTSEGSYIGLGLIMIANFDFTLFMSIEQNMNSF